MRILAFKIVHWAEPCREGANAYSYGLTTECLTVTQSTVIGLAGLANLPHELVLRAANWIKLALLANGRETPYLRTRDTGSVQTRGVCKTEPRRFRPIKNSHFFQFSSSFSRERSQSTILPSYFSFLIERRFFLAPVNCKQSCSLLGRNGLLGIARHGRNAQIPLKKPSNIRSDGKLLGFREGCPCGSRRSACGSLWIDRRSTHLAVKRLQRLGRSSRARWSMP